MRKVCYEVGKAEDFPLDSARVVPLGPKGGECAIVHHAGRFYAVGSLCPHQNAPLEGATAENGCLQCRRHGYRFDLKTGDCLTLGGYGLPVYETRRENNSVFVTVWEYDEE